MLLEKRNIFGGKKSVIGRKEEYSGYYNTPMVPDYMKDLPNHPSDEQIDQIKDKIVKEFPDVFSDGGAV